METADLIQEIFDFNPLMARMNRWIQQSQAGEEISTLPPTQMQAMMILRSRSPLNMTQLAELLLIPRQQLTKVIDALVAKELVVRRVDESNRRVVLIELSEDGHTYLEKLYEHTKSCMTALVELMDDDQKKRFFDAIVSLKEILASLDTQHEPPRSPIHT